MRKIKNLYHQNNSQNIKPFKVNRLPARFINPNYSNNALTYSYLIFRVIFIYLTFMTQIVQSDDRHEII